jgi:hypothetical protein
VVAWLQLEDDSDCHVLDPLMLVCGAAAVCQLLTHDFQGADFATDENSLVISENMVHDTMTLMAAVYRAYSCIFMQSYV